MSVSRNPIEVVRRSANGELKVPGDRNALNPQPCPHCRNPYDPSRGFSFCPVCGKRLPTFEAEPSIDLRRIGHCQRRLMLTFMVSLGLSLPLLAGLWAEIELRWLGAFWIYLPASCGFFFCELIGVYWMANLLAASGVGVVLRLFLAILMLHPLGFMLVSFGANRHAIRKFRASGLKLRYFGESSNTLDELVRSTNCRQCTYSLIGNVSGVCPECGTPTG